MKLYALVLTMIAFPCLQLLPRGRTGPACARKARRLRTPDPWTDALRSAARLAALGPRDQHVLEVLAGAAARAPVDVATQTPVEA